MPPTTIHVKATSGSKITLDVDLSATVADLKALLATPSNADCEPSRQRLIYKGHVLKDEKSLESYGLAADHTIHLVKGPAPGSGAATTTTTMTTMTTTTTPSP